MFQGSETLNLISETTDTTVVYFSHKAWVKTNQKNAVQQNGEYG